MSPMGRPNYAAMFDALPDPIAVTGVDGRIAFVNAAFEATTGYRLDELVGQTFTKLKAGQTDPDVYRDLWSTIRTGRRWQGHLVNRASDGAHFGVDLSVAPVFDDSGTITHYVGTYRDATASRRAEQTFRSLIEASPDAMVVHRRGVIVYVNQRIVTMLGYTTAEELIGRPILDLVHPDDRERVTERVRAMTASGGPAAPQEEKFLNKDGGFVIVEVIALPVVFLGEPAILAIGRDVSERHRMTARMMEMDRTIVVGTLAAGVGHEINNPLTYVTTNLDFATQLLANLRTGQPVQEATIDQALTALRDAATGAGRVRDIVGDLRMFARGGDEAYVSVDVHAVVTSAIQMALHEVRHRALLVQRLDAVPSVTGDAGKLIQVVLNLLVNAAQAIDAGTAEENTITVSTYTHDGNAVVEVSDTGPGIPADTIAHIFDPFFTTKAAGQGSGLGLAISRKIVAAHRGRIEVNSTVGHGTTFRVALPASTAATAEPVAPTAMPLAPRRARVLVVDDEPIIGRSVARILQQHEVDVATSAAAALQLVSTHTYDVIICDLMMPDLTGMDLQAALEKDYPQASTRMVFMTGGAFTPRAQAFLHTHPHAHLAKPFTRAALTKAVADVLERHTLVEAPSSTRSQSSG